MACDTPERARRLAAEVTVLLQQFDIAACRGAELKGLLQAAEDICTNVKLGPAGQLF